MKLQHIGYLWTLDNTEGDERGTPMCEFTFTKVNPFGARGRDFDRSSPVTCEKVYRAAPMKSVGHGKP